MAARQADILARPSRSCPLCACLNRGRARGALRRPRPRRRRARVPSEASRPWPNGGPSLGVTWGPGTESRSAPAASAEAGPALTGSLQVRRNRCVDVQRLTRDPGVRCALERGGPAWGVARHISPTLACMSFSMGGNRSPRHRWTNSLRSSSQYCTRCTCGFSMDEPPPHSSSHGARGQATPTPCRREKPICVGKAGVR